MATNESHLVVGSEEQHSRRPRLCFPFTSGDLVPRCTCGSKTRQAKEAETRRKQAAGELVEAASAADATVRAARANFPKHHKATQKHTSQRGTR